MLNRILKVVDKISIASESIRNGNMMNTSIRFWPVQWSSTHSNLQRHDSDDAEKGVDDAPAEGDASDGAAGEGEEGD